MSYQDTATVRPPSYRRGMDTEPELTMDEKLTIVAVYAALVGADPQNQLQGSPKRAVSLL